jgi:serine protease Do
MWPITISPPPPNVLLVALVRLVVGRASVQAPEHFPGEADQRLLNLCESDFRLYNACENPHNSPAACNAPHRGMGGVAEVRGARVAWAANFGVARMGYRSWVPNGYRVFFRFVAGSVLVCALLIVCVSAASGQGVPSSSADAVTTTVKLADLQDQFQTVATRVAATVVAISASVNAFDSDDALKSDSLNGDKLDAILSRTTRTVGTGFIIDSAGYIVTNEHVIGDAQQLWVTTDDRKVYPAMVVGSDPRADLAVLKIPAANLPVATFAPPGTVRRGMWTIALGNPYGLAEMGEMAMSVGVVSATDRSLPKLSVRENRLYSNLIQTTAEINPGNSGGPLFDVQGRVIGINAAVVLPQKQQTNGIGFAMPVSDELLAKIADLKQGREIIYGYLGVMVSTPTARERHDAGVAGEVGVIVDSVEKDSPAGDVLKVGDVLTNLNGQIVRDSDQFVRIIGAMPVDRPTRLDLRRDGRSLALNVTTRKRELPTVAVTRDSARFRWRGLLLGPIPANWNFGRNQPQAPKGVMVLGVETNSQMAKEGIQAGAVITSIGGKSVGDLLELQKLINDTPAELCRIEVARPGNVVATTGN